jgi:hypothetical protein
MIDADIGWGDQDRLGMGHRFEAILAVAVSNPGALDTPEWHCLNEQMDVGLIDRAAPKGQGVQEVIDSLLILAE